MSTNEPRKQQSEKQSWSNKKFVQKPRPTHFLSLRIDNPHIVNGVKTLQDNMISRYPHLQPYLTSALKSHLTLFILNCPTSESIEKAKQTLASCKEILNQHYSAKPCSVNIGGLGTFNDRVVFVGLEESDNAKKLQEFVYAMYLPFKEAGLTCDEMGKPWIPHCTIMKLSKVSKTPYGTKKPKKIYKIEREAYEHHMAIQFGEQIFSGVELSAMSATDPDGFYKCEHKELFELCPSSSSNLPSSSPFPSTSTTTTTTSTSEK